MLSDDVSRLVRVLQTEADVKEFMNQKKFKIVLFFWNSCGPCKAHVPKWIQAGVFDLESVLFAAVERSSIPKFRLFEPDYFPQLFMMNPNNTQYRAFQLTQMTVPEVAHQIKYILPMNVLTEKDQKHLSNLYYATAPNRQGGAALTTVCSCGKVHAPFSASRMYLRKETIGSEDVLTTRLKRKTVKKK